MAPVIKTPALLTRMSSLPELLGGFFDEFGHLPRRRAWSAWNAVTRTPWASASSRASASALSADAT